MRRALGFLLLVTLVLAGCGDDDGGEADPSPADRGPEWTLVEIVHETAVGGVESTTPTPIPDAAAVADFSAQFERPELGRAIDRVVRDNPPEAGFELVAAVVSIGCDVPHGVTYDNGEVRPRKVADPQPECFAPVTSVAILAVAG